MRVLVVLPTYNERGNIERMIRAVHDEVPDAGILVVDDSSPDGTAEIAGKVAAEIDSVDVLERPGKAGLGTAYLAGIRWSLDRDYDVVVQMDADFSHDPAALTSLLVPFMHGAELVIGSRYVPGGSIPDWTLGRRVLSRFGNVYSKTLLGIDIQDLTTGYRAYATQLLRRLDLDGIRADSYGFNIEMAYQSLLAGAAVVEVPIDFVDRFEGSSKLSAFTVAEALVVVTWLGFRRVLRGRDRSAPVRPD